MRTAMKYFSDMLDSNGGDSLLSIGSYNGWHKGMTYVRSSLSFRSCGSLLTSLNSRLAFLPFPLSLPSS